jgi:Spore Coat Protein U domain
MLLTWSRGVVRHPVSLLFAVLSASCVPVHADTGTLNISAAVLSRSACLFATGPQTLAFGAIDPLSSAPATAQAQVTFICFGFVGNTTYSIQAGNGLNAAGAGLRRMRHTTVATSLMPYALTITPASGTIARLAAQTVTINGTVQPVDFESARAGSYSDTVVLQLDP